MPKPRTQIIHKHIVRKLKKVTTPSSTFYFVRHKQNKMRFSLPHCHPKYFNFTHHILRYKSILVNGKITPEMNRSKEALEQKEIKQTWLAEKLGKSYNTTNVYAQNPQQPRLETLMEIANILDLDVKELIISNKENN